MSNNVVIVKDWETHKKEEAETDKLIFWLIGMFVGIGILGYLVHLTGFFSGYTSFFIGFALFMLIVILITFRKKIFKKR